MNSSTWLPQSANEWMASASMLPGVGVERRGELRQRDAEVGDERVENRLQRRTMVGHRV
jgi:hypothetical protein